MSYKKILTALKRYHGRLNGSTVEYDLTSYQSIVDEITDFKSELENKSDSELKDISRILIKRARNGESPDNLLIETYALVSEAVV